MKTLKFTLFSCLSLLTTFSNGQESVEIESHSQDSIGFNKLTGATVFADVTKFSEPLYHILVDSTGDNLLVQLRETSGNGKWYKNKGHVLGYSSRYNSIKWIREVDYGNSLILHFDKTIVEQKRKKSTCFDIISGKEQWEIKSNIIYANTGEFALAYNAENLKTSAIDLQGINTKTGKVNWTREVDRNYGWRQIAALDTSKLLVTASGIHVIDIHTGDGWSFHEQSGKVRYNFWTNTNTLYNISSNAIADSSSIFYASATEMIRFNHTGEQVWTYPLPDKMVSKSMLIDRGDDILMINFGYVNSTNQINKNYGRPFIASFDKATGRRNYLTINNSKGNHFKGWRIVDDKIFIVSEDEAIVFDLSSGTELLREHLYDRFVGRPKYVLGPGIYTASGDSQRLSSIYDQEAILYYVTDKDKVVGLDAHMKVIPAPALGNLYHENFQIDGLKFMTCNNRTVVIDEHGLEVAELKLTSKASVIQGKIYDLDGFANVVVDWAQFSR